MMAKNLTGGWVVTWGSFRTKTTTTMTDAESSPITVFIKKQSGTSTLKITILPSNTFKDLAKKCLEHVKFPLSAVRYFTDGDGDSFFALGSTLADARIRDGDFIYYRLAGCG